MERRVERGEGSWRREEGEERGRGLEKEVEREEGDGEGGRRWRGRKGVER